MRFAVVLAALLLLAARCDDRSEVPAERTVTVRGRLTDESGDCPTLRDRNNVLYTLSGSTEDYKRGDRVCVKGRIVESSLCGKGITIAVEWIGLARFCP